jgi:hypothetical protein
MKLKNIVLICLLLILSGCDESDRYPNAQACGHGQNMMERGEGFSNERWSSWCDAYGVSE